jgi:hypothetical protein
MGFRLWFSKVMTQYLSLEEDGVQMHGVGIGLEGQVGLSPEIEMKESSAIWHRGKPSGAKGAA